MSRAKKTIEVGSLIVFKEVKHDGWNDYYELVCVNQIAQERIVYNSVGLIISVDEKRIDERNVFILVGDQKIVCTYTEWLDRHTELELIT